MNSNNKFNLDDLIQNALIQRLQNFSECSTKITEERIDKIIAAAETAEPKTIKFPEISISERASELMAARNGGDQLSEDLLTELDRLMEENDNES